MQKTQHRWWYCNQTFRVKGQEFTYLYAGFEFVKDVYESVIYFTDGKKRFFKPETEFFKSVSTLKFELPPTNPYETLKTNKL